MSDPRTVAGSSVRRSDAAPAAGGSSMTPRRPPVPYRTILASIALVLVTYLVLMLLARVTHIVTLLVVSGFLAIVLNPVVDALHTRLKLPRALATLVTFIIGLALIAGMLYAFIRPLVEQVSSFSDEFPAYVEEARAGKGPVGSLVKRYELQKYVEDNKDKLSEALTAAGKQSTTYIKSVFSTLAALFEVLVLTFLLVLEGPKVQAGFLKLVPPDKRARVQRVARDSSRAMTGYMGGNLAISVIAGLLTWIMLTAVGVPFAGVLALWVAFTDLIPLIGATIGAIVTVAVAFLHSPTAGVVALIFYIAYQQLENHLLQPVIMSKTVNLNPLSVLVSVLIGVELFGILGALLAIPIAGVLDVVARDIYDEDLHMLKEEPTIGSDEVPVTEVIRRDIAEAAGIEPEDVPDEVVEAVDAGEAVPLRPEQ